MASRYLLELLNASSASGLSAKPRMTGQVHMDDALPGSETTAQDHTTLPMLLAAIIATMEAPTTGRNHRGGVTWGVSSVWSVMGPG